MKKKLGKQKHSSRLMLSLAYFMTFYIQVFLSDLTCSKYTNIYDYFKYFLCVKRFLQASFIRPGDSDSSPK